MKTLNEDHVSQKVISALSQLAKSARSALFSHITGLYHSEADDENSARTTTREKFVEKSGENSFRIYH